MSAFVPARPPRAAFPAFARRLAALLLLALCLAAPAPAQQVAPFGHDAAFGIGGFASLPTLTPNAPGPTPLGFVRMPVSTGYVYFSVQQVNGVPRIVASRYTDEGALYTPWGSGGSQTYSLPIPIGGAGTFTDEIQARVAVNVEGTAEIVYLAMLYKDAQNVTNLLVARLDSNGGLLSAGNSTLSNGLSRGPGAITAIATANAGTLQSGNPGLLLAVQGRETEIDTTELIQVSTPANSNVTTIFEYPTGDGRLTRADLRIRHMALRDDGSFDIVGNEGGKATYILYNAHTFRVLRQNYFTLSCGSSVSSVADGLLRDSSLSGAALLVGRADCGGGDKRPVVAKVQDIDTFPTLAWTVVTADRISGCTDLLLPCLSSFITMASPGRAAITTPAAYLSVIDAAGAGTIVRRDALFSTGVGLSILPSFKVGASRNAPYLTGLAMQASPGVMAFGMARLPLDRIFGSGMDTWVVPVGE